MTPQEQNFFAILACSLGEQDSGSRRFNALYGRPPGANHQGGAAVAPGDVPIEAAGSGSGRFIAAGIRHSF
jgi:hypothetical protein